MSSFSHTEFKAAEAAKAFYKDAVASIMEGDVAELKKLVSSFLDNTDGVTMEDILEQFHSEGKTILHLAASSGHVNVVTHIISESKDPRRLVNLADNAGFTPLINATISESIPIMKMLINLGANVNARNNDGATAAHFAAGDGAVERLQILCEAGADLTLLSQSGTPLHWASGKGHVDALSYLISEGADANARSDSGLPAIFLAAAAFSDACASVLVRSGADIGFIVTGNLTILHMCAENGLEMSVKLMLEAPTNTGINCARIPTVDGNLAIHMAAMGGHRRIVELLLSATPLIGLPDKHLSEEAKAAPGETLFELSMIAAGSTIDNLLDDILLDGSARLQQWEAKYMSPQSNPAPPPAPHLSNPITPTLNPVTDPEIITKADELKAAGNVHFSRQEYTKAIECYTQALQLLPDNAALWSNSSAAKLSSGDLEGALRDAEICRRLQPEWAKGCYRLAAARLALGMFEDAAVSAFEGTKLDENNADLKKILKEAVQKGRLEHQAKTSGGDKSGRK